MTNDSSDIDDSVDDGQSGDLPPRRSVNQRIRACARGNAHFLRPLSACACAYTEKQF